MDTNVTRKISLPLSEESRMLAKKAREELEAGSTTTVVCPKCKAHPTLIISPDGSRSEVSSNCGYIINSEIYF